MLIYISQFINMAFPKAGILYHGLPVTVSTLLFGVTLIYVMIRYGWKERPLPKVYWIVYLLFCLWVLTSLMINGKSLYMQRIASAFVLMASPLAVWLGWRVSSLHKALRIMAVALIMVAVYAIVQWFGGIEETTIRGLNLAWGESWRTKPIAIIKPGSFTIVKWPSTYQNGNLAGVFYIMAWPVLLAWKTVGDLDKRLRFAALSLGIIGLMLCGSRSAVYTFAVMLPFMIWVFYCQQGRAALKYLAVLLLTVMVLTGALNLSPRQDGIVPMLIGRYVEQTIKSPTSGRIVQYGRYANRLGSMESTNKYRSLLFGVKSGQKMKVEGFISVAKKFGYPAVFLFMGTFALVLYYACWRRPYTYLMALGLITGAIPFILDGSFEQPPTLLNWFFVAGLLLHPHIAEFLTSGNRGPDPAAGEQATPGQLL